MTVNEFAKEVHENAVAQRDANTATEGNAPKPR